MNQKCFIKKKLNQIEKIKLKKHECLVNGNTKSCFLCAVLIMNKQNLTTVILNKNMRIGRNNWVSHSS